jgi:predicted metal-binding protein
VDAEIANPPNATLLVCVTCKSDEWPLGAELFAALGARLAADPDIALKPIECLSVCKRPCTVALAAAGKWTYVVGDLTREAHVEDIVTAARRYAASPAGIVPWRERPLSFRRGVVSRTPPLALAATSLP